MELAYFRRRHLINLLFTYLTNYVFDDAKAGLMDAWERQLIAYNADFISFSEQAEHRINKIIPRVP